MNQRSLKYALALASVLTLGAGSALAQATAPASTADKNATAEDTVVLTPFEVTSEKDTGYASTETLAGTRIRTDLKDIGSSISVINKEFMRDIGATDNATLLQYTNNAEVGGVRSTFTGVGNGSSLSENATLGTPQSNTRIRGLTAADNTRDFFGSDIPIDFYNVDRVEIQRGPNSILFSLGKPAGVVNASLRNAEFKDSGEATLRYGSFDSSRASFDINQQIISKTLAVRFSQLWNKEYFRQQPAFASDRRTSFAVRFDPKLFSDRSFNTSIKAKFENGDQHSNRPRVVTPIDQITPWFRAEDYTQGGLAMGGLNRATYNPYSFAWNSGTVKDGKGQREATDPDYNPWIVEWAVNQQQPSYYINGATGSMVRPIYGGYIPVNGRSATGAIDGTVGGYGYVPAFLSLGDLGNYATLKNLPGASFGMYRGQSLTDASIFDFYNKLIDGPNKNEWSHWNAYNISLSQTAWGDRAGLEATFDHQQFARGQYNLFNNPSINIDINSTLQDLSANPMVRTPFILGNGGSSSYSSTRETARFTAFGELRTADFFGKNLLTKILGRHRINGVYSNEKWTAESRSWNNYGTTAEFDKYVLGSVYPFSERPPIAVIYLGNQIGANTTSASGLNIPNVTSAVTLTDGPMYHWNGTWKAASTVGFGDTWNRATDPTWSFVSKPNEAALVQADNPANYVGWNSNYNADIQNAAIDGQTGLINNAALSYRKVSSWAGTLQSYLWRDALVTTIGWRSDTVTSAGMGAPVGNSSFRGSRNTDPTVYNLNSTNTAVQRGQINDHSLSWGGVLHLNKILEKDFLPINISLSYNRSSNFEVTDARKDFYGNILGPSRGETKDMGVRLSTKDDKFSLRVTKYLTTQKDATSTGISAYNLNQAAYAVARGLSWANIFEFDIDSGYTSARANSPSTSSNYWRCSYGANPATVTAKGQTVANEEAAALEKSVITAWRDLQFALPKEFYTTWGLTGAMDPFVYSTRSSTTPDFTKLQAYNTTAPAGVSVTEDAESKGYEYEATFNPTSSWRIALNASETTAIRSNIGGASLKSFVELMDHYMYETDAGNLREFSGGYTPNPAMRTNRWNAAFRSTWTLKQLQDGAAASEIRKWRYNVTSNYSFKKGLLKGAGVGASYRWEDKVIIGYPVIASADGRGTYDLTKPYYGPSEDALDLWFSYEHKLTKKINWKVQLNVRNALAKKGLIPISVQADGSTWAGVRVAPTPDWFLTNTFSF